MATFPLNYGVYTCVHVHVYLFTCTCNVMPEAGPHENGNLRRVTDFPTCTVPVNKKFTSDDRPTVRAFPRNCVLTPSLFRTISVPFLLDSHHEFEARRELVKILGSSIVSGQS